MAESRGGNSDPHDHNGIPIHDHTHNRSTKGIPITAQGSSGKCCKSGVSDFQLWNFLYQGNTPIKEKFPLNSTPPEGSVDLYSDHNFGTEQI
eukprot:scaffold18755_cov99-Amphora_coffeaeformis.AAC.1